MRGVNIAQLGVGGNESIIEKYKHVPSGMEERVRNLRKQTGLNYILVVEKNTNKYKGAVQE